MDGKFSTKEAVLCFPKAVCSFKVMNFQEIPYDYTSIFLMEDRTIISL